MTTSESLALALAHHQAGRLPEAEALYRRILGAEPGHADALHLLGVLAHQAGDNERAVELIGRAIAVNAGFADYHSNLGHALWELGRPGQAEAACRRALGLREGYPEAWNNLGNALWAQGRQGEAIASYERALGLRPEYVEAWNNLGNARRAQGQLAEAEAGYRRALGLRPEFAEAWSNLGMALRAQGRLDQAITCYERALGLRPDFAAAHNNLGNALAAQDKREAAIACYRRAIAARPGYAEAHYNLGNIFWDLRRFGEAIGCYERAVALEPGYVEAHMNLGNMHMIENRHAEAQASYERVLALAPDNTLALLNLGNALNEQGRMEEAEASYRRALAIRPDYADAHSNLGNALTRLGRPAEAEAHYRRALELRMDFAEALSNLSNALTAQGKLTEAVASAERALALSPYLADSSLNLANALAGQARLTEAEAACRRALALRPEFAEAHGSLGNVLTAAGRLGEALASYRRALGLKADYPEVHSNLIFALDMTPGVTSARAYAERRRWNARYGRPLAVHRAPHANERDPERRLRVGYVSADFREHSAAMVFGPVVLSHDPAVVEVVGYAGVLKPDHVTARFEAAAGRWRSMLGVSDEALARQIRQDGIDILVDLSGHSGGHRLQVFARKPAPVQVTAWGYALGTGLDAMDYFFADPVTVPAERRGEFSEAVVDLPAFVPYSPIEGLPEVGPLPAGARGAVTFGCFNRLSKLTAEALALWAEILEAVPGARLVMKFHGLDQPDVQARLRGAFEGRGVAGARVEFLGGTSPREHLAAYGQVDLALDPFPHGGGVTALDGLWMGVPMVTLCGERIPARLGASMLTTLGLGEFIAGTPEEYVARAVGHARALDELARVRAGLRERMRGSVLCDHRAYCRAVEDAYRWMWRRWCASAA